MKLKLIGGPKFQKRKEKLEKIVYLFQPKALVSFRKVADQNGLKKILLPVKYKKCKNKNYKPNEISIFIKASIIRIYCFVHFNFKVFK